MIKIKAIRIKISNKSNLIDKTFEFLTKKFSIIQNNLFLVASTKSGAGTQSFSKRKNHNSNFIAAKNIKTYSLEKPE
jgi:hypothetical protein